MSKTKKLVFGGIALGALLVAIVLFVIPCQERESILSYAFLFIQYLGFNELEAIMFGIAFGILPLLSFVVMVASLALLTVNYVFGIVKDKVVIKPWISKAIIIADIPLTVIPALFFLLMAEFKFEPYVIVGLISTILVVVALIFSCLYHGKKQKVAVEVVEVTPAEVTAEESKAE